MCKTYDVFAYQTWVPVQEEPCYSFAAVNLETGETVLETHTLANFKRSRHGVASRGQAGEWLRWDCGRCFLCHRGHLAHPKIITSKARVINAPRTSASRRKPSVKTQSVRWVLTPKTKPVKRIRQKRKRVKSSAYRFPVPFLILKLLN